MVKQRHITPKITKIIVASSSEALCAGSAPSPGTTTNSLAVDPNKEVTSNWAKDAFVSLSDWE